MGPWRGRGGDQAVARVIFDAFENAKGVEAIYFKFVDSLHTRMHTVIGTYGPFQNRNLRASNGTLPAIFFKNNYSHKYL